ncbi:TPA_asm: hypothetical protein GDL74_21875 [Salmonella enterica]|nr:hypothetical protein [Salmonella enterica]EKQ5162628.1 hypothetical protein [Salmonella enterica]ELL0184688.1 hypothetical protein [Salmonella enterica]HAA0721203.1 hypothetical protein [Salmonella enterica]
MVAEDATPDLVIAGQYPVIQNNTLVGVRIRARNLGYTIINPKIRNNIFRLNSILSVFPALIDFTDFTDLVAEGNDFKAATYTDVIVSPANCNTVSFKRVGQAEGFIKKPSVLYGSKLACTIGDIVMNREPSITNNKYAWVCVDAASKLFGDLNIGI